MTKRRDRYQSAFGAGVRGIRSATYDIDLVLYMLESLAERHELLRERTQPMLDGQSWTMAQLLEIAHDALNTSVTPVSWIYERLQQNEEAAQLMAQTMDIGSCWPPMAGALTNTLNNRAIVSRGFVSSARRMIAKREAEAAERGGEP